MLENIVTLENIAFTLLWIGGFGSVWSSIANVITGTKRQRLVERWNCSGSYVYAHQEYGRVTYNQHLWRVFTFRSAKSLYGPLTQGFWNHIGNNVKTYDKYWWRCYQEIYLKLDAADVLERRTRYYMARGTKYGMTLPFALERLGVDIPSWLKFTEEEQAKSILPTNAGAEEYDQIMAAQEIVEHL